LAVGTAVKVRFRVPTAKNDIEAEALIAWTDRRVGMGLQFTKVSAADQATSTITFTRISFRIARLMSARAARTV
jgi:hypothetical protein